MSHSTDAELLYYYPAWVFTWRSIALDFELSRDLFPGAHLTWRHVNVISFEGSPYKPSITGGVPASRAAIATEGDTLLHLAVRKKLVRNCYFSQMINDRWNLIFQLYLLTLSRPRYQCFAFFAAGKVTVECFIGCSRCADRG